MPSSKKRIPIYLTEEQHTVLEQLVAHSNEVSITALIRKLIQSYASAQDVIWPDDDNTWGGYRYKEPPNTSLVESEKDG